METVIPFPPQPTVAVAGTEARFPVRRIFCVGRNYAAHAREMGNDDREPPFFFTKPADAVVDSGATIPYPPETADLHHEVELVVAVGAAGRNVSVERARDLVYGYAVGIDLTRRDLQAEAKRSGRPWDMAKGFDHSAPCGAIAPVARIGHPQEGAIRLAVAGRERQAGDLSQMVWSVAETISCLSRLVELARGDLVFTGTPAGVGAVGRGERMDAHIDGIGDIAVILV